MNKTQKKIVRASQNKNLALNPFQTLPRLSPGLMSRDYVLTRNPSHRLSDRLAVLRPNDSTNGIRRELAGYQQNNPSREELNCGRPPSELPTASLEELRYGRLTNKNK